MLYIRVDMNNTIATGHLMRCMAIADAARTMGEETTFLLADEEAVSFLEEKGYSFVVLHSDWGNVEGELDALIAVIHERGIKRLLIDSYQVTERYLGELGHYTSVVYMDDINAFYYPVDALICYANYWRKFPYEQRYPDTELYLGEQYTPLREEFCNCGEKQINKDIDNLLLISGGTDHRNVVESVLKKISKLEFQNIHVICGRYNSHWAELQKMYADYPGIHVHKNITDIKHFFEEADVAISAGGITLYELCACGTPTISFALADNQLDNVRQFAKDGLIECAGDARREDVAVNIMSILEQYSYDERVRRSREMQKCIDGEGAMRIAKILFEQE